MLQSIKKAYMLVFYVQYRCANSFGRSKDGGGGEEGAIFGMSILQLLLIWELIHGAALSTGQSSIVVPKFAWVLAYLFFLFLPYFVLVRKHQWLPYKAEFERYSRRKRFLGSLCVGVLMAALVVGPKFVQFALSGHH
jgi:hypothetical protein